MPNPQAPAKTSSAASTKVSARADSSSPRKRPAVDLTLVDARLDELFAPTSGTKKSSEEVKKPSSSLSPTKEDSVFRMLSHSQITVRPQVRHTFPETEMMELRSSIRELRSQKGGIEGSGILQALLVTPAKEGFRLVAGERRFRASQSEGVDLLPCVVVETVSESAIRLLQLTENALRTPPPILEESRAIKSAMEAEQLSLRNMARLLGKDKSYVEVRVNLLKYPSDVQEMVSARADTLRHARHLATISDENLRSELISAVTDEGIGEREVKRRLKDKESLSTSSNSPKPGSPKATKSTESVLQGALRATEMAVKKLKEVELDDEARKHERTNREKLRAMIIELDELLG